MYEWKFVLTCSRGNLVFSKSHAQHIVGKTAIDNNLALSSWHLSCPLAKSHQVC